MNKQTLGIILMILGGLICCSIIGIPIGVVVAALGKKQYDGDKK